jgi:hypothetical protein
MEACSSFQLPVDDILWVIIVGALWIKLIFWD